MVTQGSPGDVRAGGAYVDISIRTKGLKEGLANLKKNLRSVAIEVGKIGTVATVTAGLLSKTFLDYAKLAALQMGATSRLNAVLKSTGGIAGITTKELEKMALGLEDLTSIGGEVITHVQAILLTFTKIGKKVFPDALLASADIAKLFGGDMTKAAIQLGKALQDPVNGIAALNRSGVSFSSTLRKTIKGLVEQNKLYEAQSIILREIKSQGFGGQAAAFNKTFTGQLLQAKRRVDEVREAIGSALIPTILRYAKTIERAGIIATKWIEDNEDVAVSVAKLTGLVSALGIALTATSAAALLFSNSWSVGAAIAATALLSISDSLGLIDTGFGKITDNLTIFGNTLHQWAQKLTLTLMGLWQGLMVGLHEAAESMNRKLTFIYANLLAVQVELKLMSKKDLSDFAGNALKGFAEFKARTEEARKELQATADALENLNAEANKSNKANGIKSLSDLFNLLKTKALKFWSIFQTPADIPDDGAFGGGAGAASAIAGVPSAGGVGGFFGAAAAGEQIGGFGRSKTDSILGQMRNQDTTRNGLLREIASGMNNKSTTATVFQ